MNAAAAVSVNGRRYRAPDRPVVVVCIDGSEPEYFERGLAERATPALARFRRAGVYRLARSVVPSFTNPNNLSIVTGASPAVHGISGNYFYDPVTGQEVMMNDPKFLRCETLLAALSRAGARVAVVTAKDKLRRLLGHGMQGICFSSEKADETTKDEHGIERATDLVAMPVPSVYSAELSEYVLAAGLELLERQRPDVMYLSLTDYVQHKHAPGTPAATAFYAMLDRYFDAFDRAGAVLGITADHGMNAKSRADGTPNVVYLRPLLDALVGPGRARVILPITDPYVVHHGALGSFATIYVDDPTQVPAVSSRLAATPGIAEVYDNAAGCARFELPRDRVGDLIVIGDIDTVLGKSPAEHDLSLLEEPLRSHGGVSEQTVPFVINRPLDDANAQRLARAADVRNFDLFDYVLNGVN
ncbi:MAG: phosphonoacetate hydrolase [Candidatus Rokuibacteriota bacterium]|nr:MAG: phosphonoacetate hydrolase [Candidatus Rokubacteria bacterium]